VIEIPVQVNGKVRAKIQVPAEAGESEVIDIATRGSKRRPASRRPDGEARDLRARANRQFRGRRLRPLAGAATIPATHAAPG
jgi:hypothetical protein